MIVQELDEHQILFKAQDQFLKEKPQSLETQEAALEDVEDNSDDGEAMNKEADKKRSTSLPMNFAFNFMKRGNTAPLPEKVRKNIRTGRALTENSVSHNFIENFAEHECTYEEVSVETMHTDFFSATFYSCRT